MFTAWVESVYHRGDALGDRAAAAGALPRRRARAGTADGQAVLREAFLWSEKRTVSKTGTFGMHGNDYEVDARARPVNGSSWCSIRWI